MDTILEQFNLDFDEFDFIDQSNVFNEDGYEFYKKTITEASAPVEKKSIFSRLINLIKKFFSWIARAFKRFIGWIQSLFKKKTKTADQIISEMPRTNPQMTTNTTDQKKRIDIILSHSDNSIPIQDHIDISFKSLLCKFSEDGKSVQFNVSGINTALNDENFDKLSDIKRQTVKVGHGAYILATVILVMIKDNKLAQKFQNLTNDFLTSKYLQSDKDAKSFLNRCMSLDKEFVSKYKSGTAKMKDETFNLEDFTKFNQMVIDINKGLESIDAERLQNSQNNSMSTDVIKGINMYAGWAANFQMAMNLLMGTMTNVYTVDASYEKSFHEVNELADFAEKAIKAQIPAKYIAYNLYILSDDKLRGSSDVNHPAIGQSRIAFFPEGLDTVNKFAVNAWGIRSNKIEIQISKILSDHNYGNLIAKVKSSSNNSCAIALEKLVVDPGRAKSGKIIDNLKTAIDDACKQSGIRYKLSSDIHPYNIGFTSDMQHAKVIDYALVT